MRSYARAYTHISFVLYASMYAYSHVVLCLSGNLIYCLFAINSQESTHAHTKTKT